MNKQKNKLVLKKETLRDLTAQNAREVKGGKKGGNVTKKKQCASALCTYQCVSEYCW